MNNLESQIADRFNQAGHQVVGRAASSSNFMLRAVLRFFKLPQPPHHRLLDVGAGWGKFIEGFQTAGFQVTGVEPATQLLESARQLYPGVSLVRASATNLPFPDNSFDYVACIEVLEHIPDTDRAVAEMMRVLRPGGKLIIIDKNIRSLHPIHFMPTQLWKRWLERRNRWMYPSDFPFQEKYFVPTQLNRIIRQYATTSSIQYLRFYPEARPRSLGKRWAWTVHQMVSRLLHAGLPGLSFYVAWEAVK